MQNQNLGHDNAEALSTIALPIESSCQQCVNLFDHEPACRLLTRCTNAGLI
jgi:hypothetical protein